MQTLRSELIDPIFAQFDRADSPGCALGIYQEGRMVYARGYGLADLDHRVPITTGTMFDIGSTSKQFTATAVVLLAHDGMLSLEDDIHRWIPELPKFGRVMTVRNLLNHTSGLRDYIDLLILAGVRTDDVTTRDDALAMIVRQCELNFEPGDEYLYSNSGYFLLSVIVERVSGHSLRDFARERIFDPLGMERTHYLGSYNDVVADRATGYSPRDGGGWEMDVPRWLQTGDGAVFTNIEELFFWDSNFYDPRVGDAKLIAALLVRGVLTTGKVLPYALGLVLGSHRSVRTVSHDGGWGGFRAELMRYPDQRTSIAVLCNAGNADPSALAQRVAEVILTEAFPETPAEATAAPPPPPPSAPPEQIPISPSALNSVAGSYHSPELGATCRIARDSSSLSLLLERRAKPTQRLDPQNTDELTPDGGSTRLRLQRDASGLVTGFLLDLDRIRNIRFNRVR